MLQVTKIHQIMGTPGPETLAKLKKHSNSHIDFNFPHKDAQQMSKLIPHCSPDCVDVIAKLLAYDPDDRLSARQAVKHAYFKEERAREAKMKEAQNAVEADGGNELTHTKDVKEMGDDIVSFLQQQEWSSSIFRDAVFEIESGTFSEVDQSAFCSRLDDGSILKQAGYDSDYASFALMTSDSKTESSSSTLHAPSPSSAARPCANSTTELRLARCR